MDKSKKMIEDGVVDSPPNRNSHPVTVNSPSPLRAKTRTMARTPGSNGDSISFYNIMKLLPLPFHVEC
jgi:hypothetical protein